MNDAELLSALFVGVVIAFYLMFMRPVQKEQERHKKQMRDLRPGDEVLTTAHIVARIKDIQVGTDGQTRIQLEIADGVVVTALPNALLKKIGPSREAAASAQEIGDSPKPPREASA
jgi:preprotein translocase YajC subunit